MSGRTQTGLRPAITSPSSSDRCRVRAMMTSCPGWPIARQNAWLPWVDPATENRHQSVPHSLGLGPQPIGLLDRVEPAVQRRVTRHHGAGQVLALLVPGGAHRRQRPGLRLLHPVQPGGQQRSVGRQPEGIARIS